MTVPATPTAREDKALRLAWELGRMTLTAEVHDGTDDPNPYQAKVVDVVRQARRLQSY